MVNITLVSTSFSIISGIVALGLLALAIRGFRQTRDSAMGFLAGAFALFSAKSFLVAYSVYTHMIAHETLEFIDAIGDMGTILLIAVPIFFVREP